MKIFIYVLNDTSLLPVFLFLPRLPWQPIETLVPKPFSKNPPRSRTGDVGSLYNAAVLCDPKGMEHYIQFCLTQETIFRSIQNRNFEYKHRFFVSLQKSNKYILDLIKNYPLFDSIKKMTECKYRFVWIWFMIPGRICLGWKPPNKRRKLDDRHNPFCLRLHSLYYWQQVISLFYRNEIKVLEFSQGNAA